MPAGVIYAKKVPLTAEETAVAASTFVQLGTFAGVAAVTGKAISFAQQIIPKRVPYLEPLRKPITVIEKPSPKFVISGIEKKPPFYRAKPSGVQAQKEFAQSFKKTFRRLQEKELSIQIQEKRVTDEIQRNLKAAAALQQKELKLMEKIAPKPEIRPGLVKEIPSVKAKTVQIQITKEAMPQRIVTKKPLLKYEKAKVVTDQKALRSEIEMARIQGEKRDLFFEKLKKKPEPPFARQWATTREAEKSAQKVYEQLGLKAAGIGAAVYAKRGLKSFVTGVPKAIEKAAQKAQEKLAQKPSEKLTEAEMVKTLEAMSTKTVSGVSEKEALKLAEKEMVKTLTVMSPKAVITVTEKEIIEPVEKTEIMRPPPPPSLPLPPAKRVRKLAKPMAKVPGHHAFVKEKGKYFKVTEKPRSEERALSVGGLLVDRSTARSFVIRRARKRVEREPDGLLWDILSGKFRKGKKKGVYVEKTAFAIDSPEELQGITAKGLLKLRRMREFGILIKKKKGRRK